LTILGAVSRLRPPGRQLPGPRSTGQPGWQACPGLRSVNPHADGMQVAHKTRLCQWRDGKKVIVWPDELAPGKPRFPTPQWGQRP